MKTEISVRLFLEIYVDSHTNTKILGMKMENLM